MSEFDDLMRQKAVALKYNPGQERSSGYCCLGYGIPGREDYGDSHGGRGAGL